MRTLFLACMLALAFISCNQSQPDSKNTIIVDEELRAIINQKNNTLEKLYASGEIDSAATYFSPDLIQMPPNAPAIKGKDAYIAAWKSNIAIGQWLFDLEAREVRRSGNMAVELGTYTLKFEPKANAPMPGFEDHGHYMVLWEKDAEGDWKAVWDAPVSEVPMSYQEPEVN